MVPRRVMISGLVVVVLALLWVAGSATAHPPTDAPAGSGHVHVAGMTAPLLQYQGRLTDPDTGEPVADGSHTMTFRLYESASGGIELWTETKDVSVKDGLFSTTLGDKTSLDQKWFDGRALWLGVKVGADAEATPRQMVLPVAYALSLVPGARISTTSDSAALELTNAGAGASMVVTNTVMNGLHASGGDGHWAAGVVGNGNSESHGMGVQGLNKATSGEGYGVWGWSGSPQGAGVYGEGNGGSHGVYGETFHEGGFYDTAGVLGYSVYTESAGVMGNSKFGNGVFGYISTVTSTSSAVVGYHAGAGSGLTGISDHSYGVYGQTHNDTGGYQYAGVFGRSTHTETFGVLGESTYGTAVEGRIGELGNSQPAVSGWNDGSGPGVRGHATTNVGIAGYSDNNHGVYGETTATGAYEFAGVTGRSVHSATFGVLGDSDYGVGVEGRISEPSNANPAVVGYNTGGGEGVKGYSANDVGVAGHGATYGGEFSSDGGTALRADGDAVVEGDLVVGGQLTSSDRTSLPIAYGFVNADGSLASGSPNLSTAWNIQQHWYEVSISGYSYFYTDYCTMVTLAAGCSPVPCMAQTNSASGKLLIQVYDANGSSVQASFQFVTYQP